MGDTQLINIDIHYLQNVFAHSEPWLEDKIF